MIEFISDIHFIAGFMFGTLASLVALWRTLNAKD